MAPASSKANYKSYEAQARMVRAIVAAHPDVKWNYKEISACYGSDMTEHALNHRFRRLRAQALIIHEARAAGLDMKDMMAPDDLPNTKEAVDKNNIAKYFGQSTPDGIQFQFRGIKHDADKLRAVEAAGGDVANCLNAGAAATPVSTPSKPTPARGGTGGTRSGTGRKRTRLPVKRSSSDDDDDKEDDAGGAGDNWSDRDDTPSKRAKGAAGQKTATPRRAAQKANVTIADAAAQLRDSESPVPIDAPVGLAAPRRPSIFGPVDPPKLAVGSSDPYMGRGSLPDGLWSSAMDMDDGYGDGEI
ncbi:hypothetical protein HRG_002999 [Hirsutella rhossiliensis]|uniref:Uncharacterized protein n=1 Tax=Hirsutella rhossiliensis TaxID=111463 RepID=A0A9P8SJ68_9HYPO|nr:uncharacterized protein HRG_02999 [Hirsutella rhossiliensis]KAH0964983.1 hypothetical protein HRG_02999 [Hirsutella rhossiliensis]